MPTVALPCSRARQRCRTKWPGPPQLQPGTLEAASSQALSGDATGPDPPWAGRWRMWTEHFSWGSRTPWDPPLGQCLLCRLTGTA